MGKFCCKCHEVGTHAKQTKPHTPWSNAAKGTIQELKHRAGWKMAKSSCPAKLWDHCLELEAYIRSHTALDKYELQGQVTETIMSGQTTDISPFVELPFYAWVKFWDNLANYPEPKEQLSRWLGPAINIGPAMMAKILKSNRQVLYILTYHGLTDDEHHDNAEVQKCKLFDSLVKSKLGSPLSFSDLQDMDPNITTPHYELYEDDFKTHQNVPDIDDDVNPETGDTYIGAEVSLPHGDSPQTGKVSRRDQDGDLTGTAHNNLILNTCSYQVEFPDSQLGEYSANVIAQNMLSQCDLDGNQFLLMESIVDHKVTDEALLKVSEMHVMIKGKRHQREMTKGWLICVKWHDSSTSWEKLSSSKELYPVELAEYSVAQGIDHQPAFCW